MERQTELQYVKDGLLAILGEDEELPTDDILNKYLNGWTPEATITVVLQDYFSFTYQ